MHKEIVQVGVDVAMGSVEQLHQWSLSVAEETALTHRLLQEAGLEEIVFLSTCNRKELYGVGLEPNRVADALSSVLASALGSDDDLVIRQGALAVEHLISVAAGLESALVGEHEILGQVRRAADAAADSGTSGVVTTRLFEHALTAGRRIRIDLGINGRRLSLTGLATEWLSGQLSDTVDASAAVVGSGETAQQMVTQLRAIGIGSLELINRDPKKVAALATSIDDRVHPLTELVDVIRNVDAVVFATGSPEPLLDAQTATNVASSSKSLSIVDLGVPRNVAIEVGLCAGVHLLDMGALIQRAIGSGGVGDNISVRMSLADESALFTEWQRSRAVGSTIRAVREQYESQIAGELERAVRRDGPIGSGQASVNASKNIAGKLLHPILAGLKEAATTDSPAHAEGLAARLILRRSENKDDDDNS